MPPTPKYARVLLKVSGEIVYREGKATSALPGKLVRGPQERIPSP